MCCLCYWEEIARGNFTISRAGQLVKLHKEAKGENAGDGIKTSNWDSPGGSAQRPSLKGWIDLQQQRWTAVLSLKYVWDCVGGGSRRNRGLLGVRVGDLF